MKKKRVLALGLAALMVMAAGCENSSTSANNAQGAATVSVNTGMGRYVESEMAGPAEASWCSEMKLRADGGIAFFDLSVYKTFVTKDFGVTWEEETPAFMNEISEDEDYLSNVVLGAGGEYMVETMDVVALQDYDSEAPIPTTYYYSDAEGNVTELQFNEWDNSCGKMQITDDGTPYIADFDGEIFKINVSTGKADMIFATKDFPNSFTVCGNYLIVTDIANVYLYDLTSGQLIENTEALSDFLKSEGMADDNYDLTYSCAHFAASPEGDALYVLTESGIYRYVIGGTTIEQVVDGNLNSISEPSNDLMALYVLPDGRFLVQNTVGKLFLYTFDAEMTSTPENELVIYTLYPNDALTQVISDFQRSHPDTYVTCSVGIPTGSGITYEDALKNLNTEIMSGNSPDLYLMDYLPMNTYVEKGMLTELSGIQDAWMPQEDMYENILNAYAGEDGMYAIPTRVSIPVLACEGESLEKINDLDSFVAEAQAQHELNPDVSILSAGNPEMVLRSLLQYTGMDFSDLEQMGKDELVQFLTQATTIYDMEVEAIPQEFRDAYMTSEIQDLYGPSDMELYAQSLYGKVGNLAVGQQLFALGSIGGVSYNYESLTSANLQEGGDQGIDFTNGFGGSSNIYRPSVTLSISSTTPNQELACEFLCSALSTTTQQVELGSGLPVNRDAMMTLSSVAENAGESNGGMMWDDGNGNVYSFDNYVPTADDMNRLDTMMQELDTPVLMDEVTKATILELAPDCLSGSKSAEETADEILEKIALRLSE